MAEGDSSSVPGFFRGHYEGWKEYWGERFSFLDNYKKHITQRDNLVPSWSESDVEEFIASDPIHGPTNKKEGFIARLKTAREAVKIAATGSAIGAISTAGVAWKYSKSPHGTLLSLGAGAVFGWTFGQEFANHYLQLYRLDTMKAQVKFMDWWVNKSEGRS